MAAKSPAVVPAITRTSAKTAIAVSEPITMGSITTKSLRSEPPPNMP